MYAECNYVECCYAECRNAECHGAHKGTRKQSVVNAAP
jgi:hypothetical protein